MTPRQDRKTVAVLLEEVFRDWRQEKPDQEALLGLVQTEPGAASLDLEQSSTEDNPYLLDRAEHLIAIHGLLADLFPHDPDLAKAWPASPNRAFGGRTPLAVMQEFGLGGMVSVRAYLLRKLAD